MSIGTHISVMSLNVNGLNAPTKRHRLVECIQKQDQHICCLQETHHRPKDTYRLKVRGWKNICHANGKQNKTGVAILIWDKIDFKIKITRDKKGYYIMIKWTTQEKEITIINILEDDTVKVLHSICQHIWKTQQWPQDWKSQFSFQSQRKAMLRNAQTTTQLHSSHTLVK